MECSKCKSTSIVEDEGTLICEECGFVLTDQPVLRSEVELETVGERTRPTGTLVSQYNNPYLPSAYARERGIYSNTNTAKTSALVQCSRIANLLNLSKTFEDQIVHLVSILYISLFFLSTRLTRRSI